MTISLDMLMSLVVTQLKLLACLLNTKSVLFSALQTVLVLLQHNTVVL